ncbi:ankyrin repeat and EF-hand domain-containing protein 1-like isoform X1 [Branchiostoma lanceolatum]|uniref:ankyrin repeat and EF-hand domain-containing protein 1-like isoform X1 n=1 Tax=Branchiostoma lanceolatum TaxID=7740 RepID=UPI003453B2FA
MAEKANEALLYAAENGWVEGVEAALKAGADIDFDKPGKTLTGPSSCSALFVACINGYVDVVRLLLRKGASLVKRCSGVAPIHAAAAQGRTEVVEVLVYHGATVDIRDVFKMTPLMNACSHKQVDTVRRLIELGARADLAEGLIAKRLVANPGGDESMKLIQEAIKTKLLRCCNPKCGKPGYRKTLKLCAQCKLTRYCSRDCQIQHWSVGHKKCCGQDEYSDQGSDEGSGPDPFEEMIFSMVKAILQQVN